MLEIFTVDIREIVNVDYSKFSKERIEKINRLKMPHSQLEAIGAELALIKAVKHFYPDASLPLKYYRNEHGKPYLSDYPDLYISISHSGNYAVCIASDTEAGVDIQQIRKANFRIAQRYFTREECEYIGNDELRFFDLWAKKESYVKALGTGITIPLNSFSVLDDGVDFKYIKLIPPSAEYVLWVCKFCE